MKTLLTRFVRDQSGVITIEDGLTAFFLVIGVFAILSLMSTTFGGIELVSSLSGSEILIPSRSCWQPALARLDS
jgi:Flp pilus assembly pilin Flp